MEETVKFTSFLGGKESLSPSHLPDQEVLSGAGAYCSLLEIGETRLLLDCGCLSSFDEKRVDQLRQEVMAALNGNRIDAILLTHADLAHVGALPYLCGKNGPFPETPVICTLPVLKMSYMVLYDYYIRLRSEGTRLRGAPVTDDTPGSRALSMLRNNNGLDLTLDDIDACLEHARMVKFGQRVEVVLGGEDESSPRHFLRLCAHSSGRTIGGTSWVIQQGTTEVLYAVEMNLRKELTVDGGSIGKFPVSPSLMIVESGHDTSLTAERTGKREKREESVLASLLSAVMETVRLEGSVLIPVATVGRTLELLYILGKYWEDKKLGGMYHLVYLSPMAHNVIEYAKSQLEWMPDMLSKDFYLGRSNPFSLEHLQTCSSVTELMRLGSGPKVVLATDASLSGGLSKELLLRWGGNPSCRVIFTDRSEPNTLGASIRELIANSSQGNQNQKDPIIVPVCKAERVLLSGVELETFSTLRDEESRRLEELEHRHLREKELTTLIGGDSAENRAALNTADGADTSDESGDSDFDEEMGHEEYLPEAAGHKVAGKKRAIPDNNGSFSKKTKSVGRIAQYATPRFPMFETREQNQLPEYMDEYGLDNSDLNFTDIVTSTTLVPKQGKIATKESNSNSEINGHTSNEGVESVGASGNGDEEIALNAPPSKIVSVMTRVQLTCSFKEIPPSAWGRLDFKGVKTLISKCSPKNLIILHGGNNVTHSSPTGQVRRLAHMNKVINFATKSLGNSQVFVPEVNQTVDISVTTNRFKAIVSEYNVIKGTSLSDNALDAQGVQMISIPPCSTKSNSSSVFSMGILDGNLSSLCRDDVAYFSNLLQNDGIFVTKWSDDNLDERMGVEHRANRLQQATIEISSEVVKREEDDVDNWARQYQESLSRNKKLADDDSIQPDGADEIIAGDNETFEDEIYDVEEISSPVEVVEDSSRDYTGNVNLYNSSILSGNLWSTDIGLKVGPISAGEVQLQTLQQELEAKGIEVEYKLSKAGSGAMLLCGGQVIIRKSNKNDFILEGPPCTALNAAKRAVYQRFAFL